MNKSSHLKGFINTCLMLSALLSYIPFSAHAVTAASNWTYTSFDTGTEVTMYDDNIIIPGPQLVGTIYEFVIPNFYDPLPMKKIEITMLGGNEGASGLALPGVLDIIGADSDFNNGGPA